MKKLKRRGGTEWRNNIGYERSEKGGTDIEYQNKKSEAELKEWSEAISTELSK